MPIAQKHLSDGLFIEVIENGNILKFTFQLFVICQTFSNFSGALDFIFVFKPIFPPTRKCFVEYTS